MELKVVRMDEVKGTSPDPFRMSWQLISEKMVDARNLSMGLNETYPGGMIPEHTHDTEEEVNFVFAGRGRFVAEGKEFPIEPGVCIYIPPGITHKIVNDGDEVIQFMWIFAPQLANHRK